MFGIRKATKKASVSGPAPKASATTMSRTKPSTRLARVAAPIEPRAPTTWRSWVLTLKMPRPSCMMPDGLARAARQPQSSPQREESPSGEHEVGHEADASERAPAPAQSRGAVQGALGHQDRALGRGAGA